MNFPTYKELFLKYLDQNGFTLVNDLFFKDYCPGSLGSLFYFGCPICSARGDFNICKEKSWNFSTNETIFEEDFPTYRLLEMGIIKREESK